MSGYGPTSKAGKVALGAAIVLTSPIWGPVVLVKKLVNKVKGRTGI